MNNKVYVCIEDWHFECDSGVSVNVFDSLDKAKEYLFKGIKEIKEEYKDSDSEDMVIEEDNLSYSQYEEGYYIDNHSDIYILEKEVI